MNTFRFNFQWHITDFCGNRCSHCYIDEFNRKKVEYRDALNIIKDIRGCCEWLDAKPHVALTGGDPLTHPYLFDFIKELRGIGASVGILGNPEKLNDSVVEKFKELGISDYQMSFDGMKETHDSIRSPGSFDRTSEGIKLLLKHGVRATVMSTIASNNNEEMVDVMEHVYSLGCRTWSFARWIPPSGDCGLTSGEYNALILKLKSVNKNLKGMPFSAKEPLCASTFEAGNHKKIAGGCGIGTSVLSILPDNTVMACRRHPGSVLGKWKQRGDFFNFYLSHPKMQEYREIEKISQCNKCQHFLECRGCRASAYVSSGNHFGVDPQCFNYKEI